MPEQLKVSDERAERLYACFIAATNVPAMYRNATDACVQAIPDLLADRETLTADNERLTKERDELRSRLTDAMRFVPAPEQMSGFDDPHCPLDVRELIDAASRLRTDTTINK